jgi:hypothetical protein
MSLFSKVNVSLILIAMVFALAPTATYAAAYIKFDGIGGKMPRMRVTDKTTVHEVAVFAARHAGVDVGCINLSWRGQEVWQDGQGNYKAEAKGGLNVQRRTEGKRTLGSYKMLGEANASLGYTEVEWTYIRHC